MTFNKTTELTGFLIKQQTVEDLITDFAPFKRTRFRYRCNCGDCIEFQYRILNRYLTTNSFLHKIGLANSPLCTFCKEEGESLEHLLIICSCTKSFWSDFITWSNQLNISLRDLSDSDILFGFWQRKEDYLFINHMLVLAKQHIYECRNKCTYPSFTIFLNKVSYVHQLEKKLMNSNNKVADQESKWEKFQLFCRGSEN